jgi:hypothetical protein
VISYDVSQEQTSVFVDDLLLHGRTELYLIIDRYFNTKGPG